jgi:hypothetical protein
MLAGLQAMPGAAEHLPGAILPENSLSMVSMPTWPFASFCLLL